MTNKAIIIGRLGRDPDQRVGDRPLTFSLATEERWRDKATGETRRVTDWHNVVIFEPGLIDVAETYLRKGSQVYIEGMMRTREFEGRNGKQRITEVVVRFPAGKLVLLDRREKAPGAESEDAYGVGAPDDYAHA